MSRANQRKKVCRAAPQAAGTSVPPPAPSRAESTSPVYPTANPSVSEIPLPLREETKLPAPGPLTLVAFDILTPCPSPLVPGSDEKIELMAERANEGLVADMRGEPALPLCLPGDAELDDRQGYLPAHHGAGSAAGAVAEIGLDGELRILGRPKVTLQPTAERRRNCLTKSRRRSALGLQRCYELQESADREQDELTLMRRRSDRMRAWMAEQRQSADRSRSQCYCRRAA